MVELRWQDGPGDGRRLLRDGEPAADLAVGEGIEAVNTPKPFVHPLRTPGGTVVTGFAPEDHRWHHGLQFAMPRVGDHNLWGGGTYLNPEEGYRVLEDQGGIRHLGWSDASDGPEAAITERTRWVGHQGEPLLDETRQWRFGSPTVGEVPALVVDFATELRSATGQAVPLRTPAQRGRPDGGYGGLFLRLADGFELVGIDDGLAESGGSARTMVVQGRIGGAPVTLGLAFLDGPTPGDRCWLHRFEPFCAIGWAIAYRQGLEVPADQPVVIQHRLLIADGLVDPEAVRVLL